MPLISSRSNSPNILTNLYRKGLPSDIMRSQEGRVPHSNLMMRELYSRPTLHATGRTPPCIRELLQDSSRVIVNKPPRVLHRYQQVQLTKKYESNLQDNNIPNDSLVLIGQHKLSQLLRLYLVSYIIPEYLPPLMLYYLLWDLSPYSEIYRCLGEMIELINQILQVKPDTMESTSSIGNQIVEASSSIDGNRAARVVHDVGEECYPIEKLFIVPEERDAAKIAVWVSGILLAVTITYIKIIIQKSNEQ